MIITRTPLRVSLIGGGTDIPSFYKNNDYGEVISTSINKYVYVIVKKQDPLYFEKYRLNYSETEIVNDLKKIKNPIIKACIKYLKIKDHLYIGTFADVPSSTGLGSSSSFCVGLLNALYVYKGIKISKKKLAEQAFHIEVNILKKPIGKQDHYASALGGINNIKFKSNDTVQIKNLNKYKKNYHNLFKSTSFYWSGKMRSADNVLKDQNKNKLQNKKKLIQLRNMTKELNYLLSNHKLNLYEVGNLIDQSWKIKRSLSTKISNKKINHIYNIAKINGAFGGKLLGAGGGGFLMLISPSYKINKIKKTIERFKFEKIDFKMENTGSIIVLNNK